MDYDYLLNIKIKYHITFIIVTLVLIASMVLVGNLKIYDSYNILGICNNSIIYLNIPIDYSDTITNGDHLVINKKTYNYEILDISDVEVDNNMVNYQTFSIKIDKDFMENEVINITIFYDKEKIITKIKEHL